MVTVKKKKKGKKRRPQRSKTYERIRREKMVEDGAYDGRFGTRRAPTKKESENRRERKRKQNWREYVNGGE